jgi:hypothetical protein
MAFDPETEFRHELEVFGNEVEEAIQCFYAEQTIHNFAREDENVHRALNRNAPFWNLACRALQANAVIVLGRIFDRDARAHTLNRLLQLATDNRDIFSKTALEKRKLPHAGEHSTEFTRTAYIRAVFTDILHFRARVLGVYGQGLFHGQPLTPETVSAVPSSDGMVRFSRPSPPRHTGPRGLRSRGTVSSRWSRDCVE